MMVTNTFDYLDVFELDNEHHNHGDSILKVVR